MKSGRSGGIVIVCLLVFAFVASGVEVPLFVCGEPVSLIHEAFWDDDQLLVPLSEFGLKLGIEATYIDEKDSISVHFSGGRQFFPTDHFKTYAGACYIPLDELADLVGARVHTIGKEIYVEAEPSYLTSLEATAKQVTVRFDTFTPYKAIVGEPGTIHLRFYHCSLATAPRRLAVIGGPILSVKLMAGPQSTVELVIEVSSDSLPQTRRFEAPGFYSVSLTFDHQPRTETQVELLPHITSHEIETDLGEGPVKIKYLYVREWRDHYRLTPAVPEGGVGTISPLKEMARAHGAHAAINANFFDTATNNPVGLLIVDGVVLSSNYERRAALGIDLSGRLTFFNPIVNLYLRRGAEKITIDDVNRPIKSDELIVYTEDYTGLTARSASQPFRVVKVRGDRVVAVQYCPYVVEDRSATLLVASGTARARLIGITVGEEVNVEFTLDQGDLLVTNVVSAGPLLILNGNDILDLRSESFQPQSHLASGLAARSVLATDYYGGLVLLTVVRDEGSVGANFDNLLSVLHSLPQKVKDAIAFDGGHSSSLVLKDGGTYWEISSGGRVAVGLLLVPTDR